MIFIDIENLASKQSHEGLNKTHNLINSLLCYEFIRLNSLDIKTEFKTVNSLKLNQEDIVLSNMITNDSLNILIKANNKINLLFNLNTEELKNYLNSLKYFLINDFNIVLSKNNLNIFVTYKYESKNLRMHLNDIIAEQIIKMLCIYLEKNYTSDTFDSIFTYKYKNEEDYSRIITLLDIPYKKLKCHNFIPAKVKYEDYIKIPLFSKIKYYKIKDGDSLFKVSLKTKCSLKKLKLLNDIKSEKIKVGEILLYI